jgi:hypothetical protein
MATFPPHRPYDCAMELLPGATPPPGHLYSLSTPEAAVMDNYILELLDAGFIRPSTSSACAGFFFVGKKDGGLHPCINDRRLNQIYTPESLPPTPDVLRIGVGPRGPILHQTGPP